MISKYSQQPVRTKKATASALVETVYIKDVESDRQISVKVPRKIRQMLVWNDCLYIITRTERELLCSESLSSQTTKVVLRPHPSFQGCKVKKMAFTQDQMLVLSEEGVVFILGEGISSGRSPLGQRKFSNDFIGEVTVIKAFVD